MKQSDYYNRGYERGTEIAGLSYTYGEQEYHDKDTFIEDSFIAEDQSRSFTPFEFIAAEFNRLQEYDSAQAWDDFDDGIADGIQAIADKYFPEEGEE